MTRIELIGAVLPTLIVLAGCSGNTSLRDEVDPIALADDPQPSLAARPATTASPALSLAADEVIYNSSLQNGWVTWGWAKLNPTKTGISVGVKKPWDGLYLHHSPESCSGYSNLEFTISAGDEDLNVLAVTAYVNEKGLAHVMLPEVKARTSRAFKIPLTRLALDDEDFDGFTLQTQETTTFLVGDVKLRGKRKR